MGRKLQAALAALAVTFFFPAAPAVAEEPQPPCTVTVENETSIFPGDAVELAGSATGCEGETIFVLHLRDGGWREDGTSIVDDDGTYRITVSPHVVSSLGDHEFLVAIRPDSKSEPFTIRTLGRPTLAYSPAKKIGTETNAWGRCDTLEPVQVRAEFWVGGRFLLSRATMSDASGGYIVPLTYASDTPGGWEFRIACVYPDGRQLTTGGRLTRYGKVVVDVEGPHYRGEPSSVSGHLPHMSPEKVWVEALTPSGWRTSRKGSVTWSRFSAPLTYGVDRLGPATYRVALQLEGERIERSDPFTIRRTLSPHSRRGSLNAAEVQGTSSPRNPYYGAPVGRTANAWGRFESTVTPLTVWTEVSQGDGRWHKSQVRKTDASGGYVIPITYGQHQAGAFNLLVAARYPDGKVVRTPSIVFHRDHA